MEGTSVPSLTMLVRLLTVLSIILSVQGFPRQFRGNFIRTSDVANENLGSRFRRESSESRDQTTETPSDSGYHNNPEEHTSSDMSHTDGTASHDNQQSADHGGTGEYFHGDSTGMPDYQHATPDQGQDGNPSDHSQEGSPPDHGHEGNPPDHGQEGSPPDHGHEGNPPDHGQEGSPPDQQPSTDQGSIDYAPSQQDTGSNPLLMTREGELPPLALPLQQADVSHGETASPSETPSDTPRDASPTYSTDGAHVQENTHHQGQPSEHMSTDGQMKGHAAAHTESNQPRFARLTSGSEAHTQDLHSKVEIGHMPQALALTGTEDTGSKSSGFQRRVRSQAETAPVALPQRQGPTPTPGETRRPPPNWGANKGSGGALPRARPTWRAPGASGGSAGVPASGSQPLDAIQMIQQMHAVDRMQDQVSSAVESAGDILKDAHAMGHMPDPRFDPRFNVRGGSSDPRRRFPINQRFDPSQPGAQSMFGGYPGGYPPYYGFGDRPDRPEYKWGGYPGYAGYPGNSSGFPGYNAYQGYNVEVSENYPPCTNMSDPYCRQMLQQRAMMGGDGYGREVQIEGPHGEIDIEPGELDIEGPMAHHLLKNIGLGNPNMNPLHQEITLNNHVLDALKSRFGVNTTRGVQRMSGNPEFQAFMYRVLTHSAPVAPGEYNANLTNAEVRNMLAGLDQSNTFNRLSMGNLNHAQINSSQVDPSQKVLTIDGGPQPNPFLSGNQMRTDHAWTPMQNLPSLSSLLPGLQAALPGFQTPLPQTQTATQHGAVAGRVQALVQTRGEEGGEAAEGKKGGEAREAGEGKKETKAANAKTGNSSTDPKLTTSNESVANGGATMEQAQTAGAPEGTNQEGPTVIKSQLTITDGKIVKQTLPSDTGNTATSGGEIIGKDANPALSKDHQQSVAKNEAVGQGQGTGAGLGTAMGAGSVSNSAVNTPGGSPLGNPALQEAGIQSGAGIGALNETNAVPIEAKIPKYKASTVFAVIAIVLIACAIILGPIICMLCKMKDKRDERLRKEKSLKNKDISDNSIMEAMMMHEFGADEPNSVANEGGAVGNIYKDTEHGRYVTIDPEMQNLHRQHLP